MTNMDLLFELHEAVGKSLLKKIKDGTAEGSDINAAIKFLKDNAIHLEQKDDTDPMNLLIDAVILEEKEQKETKQIGLVKKEQKEEDIDVDKFIKDKEILELLND